MFRGNRLGLDSYVLCLKAEKQGKKRQELVCILLPVLCCDPLIASFSSLSCFDISNSGVHVPFSVTYQLWSLHYMQLNRAYIQSKSHASSSSAMQMVPTAKRKTAFFVLEHLELTWLTFRARTLSLKRIFEKAFFLFLTYSVHYFQPNTFFSAL